MLSVADLLIQFHEINFQKIQRKKSWWAFLCFGHLWSSDIISTFKWEIQVQSLLLSPKMIFVHLNSNFSLLPRLSHNFHKGIFLQQTPHIKHSDIHTLLFAAWMRELKHFKHAHVWNCPAHRNATFILHRNFFY